MGIGSVLRRAGPRKQVEAWSSAMGRRLRPIRKKVEVLHDGDLLEAEAGEPLVHTLIAADRLTLARSPKLHRARGPYCLRAACDGCLVRLNGVGNVMACQHAVSGGDSIETQNVLGSRDVDLLQATDFLFPHGLDHHRLFAGVHGVSAIVQRFARRVAGLGRLPDAVADVRAARRLAARVLVIGGGSAGLAAASVLGTRALLVDDALTLGGRLALVDPERARALAEQARSSGATLRSRTTALGVYRDGSDFIVLLADAQGVCAAHAQALFIASGGHERLPPFAGNDLPGMFSARAGVGLLESGIAPGRRVAVIGSGPLAERARELLQSDLALALPSAELVVGAPGGARVRALVVQREGEQRRVSVDAVFFDAEPAPAFELAVQGGARVRYEPGLGYVPIVDGDGRAAPGIACAGSVTGSGTRDLSAVRRVAERLA